MPVVQVSYYTDPACPWSWALEPDLRKLICDFGESLRFVYVMCGMAREFGDPGGVAAESLHAAERSGMPVDARLWLHDAPRSSFPACMAVRAASEQGSAAPYLRQLRAGLMCRARKLDSTEALLEQARSVDGLDLERLRIDLGSHAILEAFGADLERAASVPAEHFSPGSERVKLPSLEFYGQDGVVHGVYGFSAYEQLHAAALQAGAQPIAASERRLTIEEAIRRFGAISTAEVAALCELPGPRAPAELWRLASEWRLKYERAGSGELWTLA